MGGEALTVQIPKTCHLLLSVILVLVASLTARTSEAQQVFEVQRSGHVTGSPALPLARGGQQAGWSLILEPYFWASGISGQAGARGRSAEIDLSFSDLIENLDFALMMAMEARKGRWGIASELLLFELSDQAGTPGPLFDEAQVGVQQTLIDLTPRYRAVDESGVALDVLLGARFWAISESLQFTPGALPGLLVEAGDQWIDPILGGRLVSLPGNWHLQARGDLGGFGVGSHLTWQLLGVAGYRLSERVTLGGGYRHLSVDFDDETKGFLFDVGIGGFILGATIGL